MSNSDRVVDRRPPFSSGREVARIMSATGAATYFSHQTLQGALPRQRSFSTAEETPPALALALMTVIGVIVATGRSICNRHNQRFA